MTSVCAVTGCNCAQSKNFYEDDGCTPLNFFHINKRASRETLKGWLKVCTDVAPHNFKSRVICSRHFLPSEISGNRHLRAKLKYSAIPTRNIGVSLGCNVVQQFAIPPQKTDEIQSSKKVSSGSCHLVETEIPRNKCQNIHPIQPLNELLPSWYCDKALNGGAWYFQIMIISRGKPPSITRSVKVAGDNSPPRFYIGEHELPKKRTEFILKDVAYNTIPGFISAMQKFSKFPVQNRFSSMLSSLSSLLDRNICAKDLDEEEPQTSETQDQMSLLNFVAEQMTMFSVEPAARRWNHEILRWAKIVHFHSPAAYRYMRDSGYVVLPCDHTLRRCNLDGITNLQTDTFADV